MDIRKYALANAIQFEGRANPGSIIGKLLAEDPTRKEYMKEISQDVQAVVKEVNALSLEEQRAALEEIAPELLEKKKKEKREFALPSLPNTEKVKMRFAPNPNGPMSFGHCRQALINWWFVEKYDGEYLLRFDDTDPRTKVPMKEAYAWFEEDLAWLGIKPHKVIKQSERFYMYYDYAKQLIDMDKAYVCVCEVEEKRELMKKKLSCACRELPIKENLKRWELMLAEEGYKEGEAVYRIKTEIDAKNPAVRDWPGFRIITSGNHPLKKAKVWPLLNFSSAIDDYKEGITHIVRGVDLSVSDERQKYIYGFFNWTYPHTLYTGKLLVAGVKSTSESKKRIESKELEGWDDIRLGTVKSLRKRGFLPQSFHEFIKSVGLNKNNIEVSIETLAAFNKDIIDATAKRYFFIKDPLKVTIVGAPTQTIKLSTHPSVKDNKRAFTTTEHFFLEKEDVEKCREGELIRLMDCLNARKEKEGFVFHSLSYEDYKKEGKHIIHWLSEDTVPVCIKTLSNENREGLGEKGIMDVKEEETIQFERVGFFRKNGDEFWFTHE